MYFRTELNLFYDYAQMIFFIKKGLYYAEFFEKTFYGPIWKQVRDVLDYINTNIIEEKVVKIQGLSLIHI